MGALGVSALAAHSAMLSLFSVATSGMYGVADACNARVGAALGAGQPRQVCIYIRGLASTPRVEHAPRVFTSTSNESLPTVVLTSSCAS